MSFDVAVIEIHAVLVFVSIKYETIRVDLSSLRINKRYVLLGTILRYLVAFYKVFTFGLKGGTIRVDTCSLRIYRLLFLRERHIATIDSTLERFDSIFKAKTSSSRVFLLREFVNSSCKPSKKLRKKLGNPFVFRNTLVIILIL